MKTILDMFREGKRKVERISVGKSLDYVTILGMLKPRDIYTTV